MSILLPGSQGFTWGDSEREHGHLESEVRSSLIDLYRQRGRIKKFNKKSTTQGPAKCGGTLCYREATETLELVTDAGENVV